MPAHRTVRDRITVSKVPVNGSIDPRANMPAWLGTITTALAVLPATLSVWAKVVLIVAGLAAGVAVQYFTVPASDVLDHDGPPKRRPGGRLQ